MKIAILICGQPRFTEDFNNTLKHLKGYDQADWFCYFTGNNQGIPSNKLPSEFWREITDTELAATTLQSTLPPNNFVRSFDLSDSDVVELPKEPAGIPTPAYKMWYNLYKVNQLRLKYEKENNVVYDMVVRIRPDAGLVSDLNLNLFTDKVNHSVITPINQIAGHLHLSPDSPQMCDLFAVSSPAIMNIYCDMFLDAHNNFFTQTFQTWHTESAHALFLKNNNVPILTYNFKISLRGEVT
jgi:hypothetical protein